MAGIGPSPITPPPASNGALPSTGSVPPVSITIPAPLQTLLNPNAAAKAAGDNITRVITGAIDGLTNLSEHLLIYTIFAVIFIMLLWVIVSDQSPAEIVVNAGKNAGELAKGITVE